MAEQRGLSIVTERAFFENDSKTAERHTAFGFFLGAR
jgi:hypothetical protein